MRSRSILKWLPKLLRRTAIKKEERNNSPTSQTLAENSCATEVRRAEPPVIPKGPEADFLDAPPPSYEDECFSPNGANTRPIEAIIEAQAARQRQHDIRVLQIVNEAVARVDSKLKDIKQFDKSIDVVYISSSIRQLCEFGASRTAEDGQRNLTACSDDGRQKTLRQVEGLFMLVFAKVDWKQQGGAEVISVATCAFRETCLQVREEHKDLNHLQASTSLWFMNAIVYRTAGLVFDHLAGDRVFAQIYAAAADSLDKSAKSSNAAAQDQR